MTPDKHEAKLRKLTGLCDDDDIDMATKRVIKARKPKPSHFVAIRLSDRSIHSSVEENVHKAADERLKPDLVPVKKLHLSLLCIHLKDEEQIEKAKTTLQQCIAKIRSVLPSGAFTLKFKGLDYFLGSRKQRRVLNVIPDKFGEGVESLKAVASVVRAIFTENGFPPTDKKEFQPHVAVIKLNNDEDREIPKESFESSENSNYGQQQVSSLYLCQIGTTAEDGFYEVVERIDFERAQADDEIGN